jgi:branched-chain amino acid transport system ATP-binding protein
MLTVEGLHAHYGRAHVLADVGFTVAAGEVVALLGRNGAGKSTTLKAVMGLIAPTAGRIRLDGRDLAGRAPFEIARAGIGWVPEDRRIFTDLTVRENLEVGRRPPAPGRTVWTPERLFAAFPALEPLADRPGGRMSGGEQQMLTIARTLLGNPAILLLDEPTEGLAPVVVEGLVRTIRALRAEGLGIVLSEQTLPVARAVADRACVIETGRIRWEGTMAALMADDAVRAKHLAV